MGYSRRVGWPPGTLHLHDHLLLLHVPVLSIHQQMLLRGRVELLPVHLLLSIQQQMLLRGRVELLPVHLLLCLELRLVLQLQMSVYVCLHRHMRLRQLPVHERWLSIHLLHLRELLPGRGQARL
jgi:hypothetical protein